MTEFIQSRPLGMGAYNIKPRRIKSWCLSAITVGVLHFAFDGAQAQGDKMLSVEIVAPQDASGSTYLPHGEPFEVRFTNLSKQPIAIWDDLCEPGHWALCFRVQPTNGESQTVVKRTVPANVWTNYPPQIITILDQGPFIWI